MPTTDRARRKLLKDTISRCPVCHQPVPAGVWNESQQGKSDRIILTRSCHEHGKSEAIISSDSRFYWLAKGSDDNRCGAGCACSVDPDGLTGTLGKNAFAGKDSTAEKLSTCLALIEIVDSCNLACPTCFADSPVGTRSKLKYHSLEELQKRISGVLERKQHIEILQLSGGEPTLHPDFFELLDWIHEQPGIDFTLINTNGVLLAKDDEFLKQLGERVSRGHIQLYLQFDGLQEAGQRDLRGADLRKMKEQAMERCQSIGLPVTLAMTVNEHNLPKLWETIEWGIGHDNCRGVSFQPMFLSGRIPGAKTEHRMNTADIILGAVEQSAGRLRFDDFTPLPCGDPNCATIGYLLKTPEGIRSISDFIDFAEVQGFLKDKVNYRIEDLAQCGCDNTDLGDILKQFEFRERDTFRLFIKPFMDAWTWDEDRIDRCCTHVIRPDGKLDSFCRYYSGFPDCSPTMPVANSTLPTRS